MGSNPLKKPKQTTPSAKWSSKWDDTNGSRWKLEFKWLTTPSSLGLVGNLHEAHQLLSFFSTNHLKRCPNKNGLKPGTSPHNGTIATCENLQGCWFSRGNFQGADGVQPQLWMMILLKSYRATLLSSCAATFRRFRAMVNLAKETASSRLILGAAWLVGWLVA